jgi:GNAT superfamily N-acetyltransferase
LHELSYRPHVERVWGWDDAQQLEYFARRFQPDQLQIVESGAVSVGVLSVEEEENALFLADVEIAPEWQGRGIGAAIVRSLQEQARAREPAARAAGAPCERPRPRPLRAAWLPRDLAQRDSCAHALDPPRRPARLVAFSP